MSAILMPEPLVQVIDRLEAGDELESKLRRLVENEIRRRLARYEWIDRVFQKKYGMTFEEFERNEMVSSLQKLTAKNAKDAKVFIILLCVLCGLRDKKPFCSGVNGEKNWAILLRWKTITTNGIWR